VYVTDLDRRIVLWNRKAEEITGHKAADVIGKACHENILVHIDKDGHKLCTTKLCPLYRAMNLNKATRSPAIIYARCADGHRIGVSVDSSPMHDAGGKVIGGIETFSDSTEQVRNLEFAKQIQQNLFSETAH